MNKCGAICEVYSRVCGYFRPVSNWNKGKKEEFRQRKTFRVPGIVSLFAAVFVLFAMTGCSHNTGAFTIGTRINAGLDPQNATANISYTDGLNVVDVSRENSSWDLEIDADNGVSVDGSAGTIKGVKRIRRDVGPQITGYLVDLAEKNPDMAKNYIESMKYYWKYRAEGFSISEELDGENIESVVQKAPETSSDSGDGESSEAKQAATQETQKSQEQK